MDCIKILDLNVPTYIGITEEERRTKQALKVSVEMCTDVSKAGTSDDVTDTIDYEVVCVRIKELGKTERNTIEKFAEDIATMILNEFKPTSVKVTVWKYILKDTSGVAVTIERNK